jgi:hypothetical protein
MIPALLRACIVATALAVAGGFSAPAFADAACAAGCNSAHDQCMKSSHDNLSCDSQRNQCLRTCGGYQ